MHPVCRYLCLFFCFSLMCEASAVAESSPKNFIIIYTDDQGYGDLGCFGATRVKTPHIDKLAQEGMKLTSWYSASSVCSPSRAALMTGRMPKRAGVPGVLFPWSETGLPQDEITIAELLKTKGYTTGLIGKWHLGHLPQFLPTNQGFDTFIGIPYSNDMSIAKELKISSDIKLLSGWTRERLASDIASYGKEYARVRNNVPLMDGLEVIEYPADQRLITRRYTEESVKFIKQNKDKPFFLYLAHTMPHLPIYTSDEFKGKTGHGAYNDSLAEIDWSVGEVIQTLRDLKLDRTTFVLFTSDNGPSRWQTGTSKKKFDYAGGNIVLRGCKFETFEGGQRVPAVAWAPGTIPAGEVCDEMGSSMDLFPTLAHWAGAKLPEDRTYDSYNLADLFSGKQKKSPRNEMYFYRANSEVIDGMRMGDFKYLKQGVWRLRKKQKAPDPMLFNVKTDKEEKRNVLKDHAEKVEQMKMRMLAFDKTVKQK